MTHIAPVADGEPPRLLAAFGGFAKDFLYAPRLRSCFELMEGSARRGRKLRIRNEAGATVRTASLFLEKGHQLAADGSSPPAGRDSGISRMRGPIVYVFFTACRRAKRRVIRVEVFVDSRGLQRACL